MKLNILEYFRIIDDIKKRIARFFFNNKRNIINNKSYNGSKTYLTATETLEISGNKKLSVKNITQNAKETIKKFIYDPDALLKFIESQGTTIIRANHIEKVLILIGEGEGFITPFKGFKALFLSLMINILSPLKIKIGFSTPAMFVMKNMPVNIYILAHQFHHWLAYSKNLPGYEEDTLNNFKNIWSPDFGANEINSMSINEILSLKEAVARDIEAINFVKEISLEFVGSKKSVNKLKNGENINL